LLTVTLSGKSRTSAPGDWKISLSRPEAMSWPQIWPVPLPKPPIVSDGPGSAGPPPCVEQK
jgi:hypothetical protein